MGDATREAVRTWLDENWDPALTLEAWWDRLADSGWAVPTWPEEWFGKGMSGGEAAVVYEEFARAKVPGPPTGLGLFLAGPTILAHGDDDQKRRFLRDILSGQKAWCQLFSEPGAGSDLASLQTRAIGDGDEWVVNGQKVWTSGAQVADYGMLVARTDVEVPKHRGISYFLIAIDQPGIEVRPLRQMTGAAHFNEVFFDDARVPHENLIGGLNNGWAVALTTLANERQNLTARTSAAGSPGRKSGMMGIPAGELLDRGGRQAGAGPGVAARSARALADLARANGRLADPVIRQDLVRLFILNEINRYTGLRIKSSGAKGRGPGPEASTMKLAASRSTRLARDLSLAILGPHAMLAGGDAPLNGSLQTMALSAPATSIAGGSDEIQRNIIGERALGLPKEPQVDRDIPFKDLKVGTQAR